MPNFVRHSIGTIIRTEGIDSHVYRRAIEVRIVDDDFRSRRETIEKRLGVKA